MSSNQISEMVDKMCNAQFERGKQEGKKQALTSEIEFLEMLLEVHPEKDSCNPCPVEQEQIQDRIAELKGALE